MRGEERDKLRDWRYKILRGSETSGYDIGPLAKPAKGRP